MVVRLKDLQDGKDKPRTGLVRLSDLSDQRKPEFLTTQQIDARVPGFHMMTPNEVMAPNSPLSKKMGQMKVEQPQQPANGDFKTDYPGGWLNPLNDLGRLANSPLLRTFTHAAGQTMGVPEDMMSSAKSTGNGFIDKVAEIAGQGAGMFVNPAQLENGFLQQGYGLTDRLGTTKIGQMAESKLGGLAAGAASKLNPVLNTQGINLSENLASNLAQRAGRGAIAGGIYGAGNSALTGKDIPTGIAENALMFGAGDAGFGLAGAGIKAAGRSIADKFAGTNIGVSLESFTHRNRSTSDLVNDWKKADQEWADYNQQLENKYGWQYQNSVSKEETKQLDRLVNNNDAIEKVLSKRGIDPYNLSDTMPNHEQQVQEMLALPPAARYDRVKSASEGTVLPSNESPIHAAGDVYKPPVLGLPQGNYVPPTRLRQQDPSNALDFVMRKIKPEVEAAITPPARRDQLINYITTHLDVPQQEVWNMPMKDLQELGQHIRQSISVHDVAVQVAAKHGHDLTSLLEGRNPTTIAQKGAEFAQQRAYGVYPESLPNVQTPKFNKQVLGEAAGPLQRGIRRVESQPQVEVVPPQRKFAQVERTQQPLIAKVGGQTAKRTETPSQAPRNPDELGHAQTVRESQNTAPGLTTAMNEKPMIGARTSDVLNRQEAAKLIEKHGTEGLYSKLMAKTKQFSASETTAAQILAKQYSSLGGEHNLSKAIDLVSKTAKGGREMGQAIQALSQWNKLDAEGALLMGERQLNRGISDTSQWQKLTPAQGAPITEAAQRIGTAQETKSLADEVLNIVTYKQAGEALTDAEKATIKQFQDQVKLINEKGKGILSKPKESKANATIKEVSKIEPKARTRDQVVSFLDAKAEKARQRLNKNQNIGIMPNLNNPVFDYAIIGASHIAKGVVKLSDFTAAMVKDFGDSVKPHIHEVYAKATNIFRKENGLPTAEELDRVVNKAVKDERFAPEDAARFKAWAAEIGHMSDEFKVEATQDLQVAMKELGDSTLGQKLATIQTGAQLLNAVTVARNVLGNAALITAEKINKVAAVPIDYAFSKLTGERTIQWLPKTQEKMLRNFMSGTEGGWKGVSPTGTLDSYGIHPNVFGKKNPLKYISKSLGASMQGFDFAAYRVAYGDVLATYGEQLGKAQKLSNAEIKQQMPKLIEQLDQRIHDLADEAGRYATFQDDTLLSLGAEMLKRGLNKFTDMPAQKLVEKGILPKAISVEGFGFGDVVLKYAKTPANLIMRAIDYSPIGFLRATMELAPLVFNKSKFNQFQATRALSRAITGTLGLTGMGYILADAGILTGSSSMDKDVRSIQEQSGQGAYKVNWSALGRFISGGFDKEAAKYQKGDHLMDYQWLQPAAISIAMGVNANKAVNDKKNGADITGWQVAQKAILGGLQTVLENPMVQGVSQVVDAGSDIIKRQDATKLKGIAKGIPASFVPTLSNQARAATDNNQRETFDKNLLTEMGNLMKNKVPGLSKTLPISYDSLGNAREKIQGGQANTVGQYLTSFFSPARMTEYQVSPEAKLVLDLMNQSGDPNILPRIESKSFNLDQGKNKKDLKVDLAGEQFSSLQRTVGQIVTKKLSEKADYLSNPNISMKNKVDKVKSILTDAGVKARESIGTQMGYKKKDIKK